MSELEIVFDKKSPQNKNENINIKINNYLNKNLLYKFIVGHNGKWNILRDFSKELSAVWSPKKEGVYTIMIQAVEENDTKPFTYVDKADYVIGEVERNLIKNIVLSKQEVTVGEEIKVTVHGVIDDILYRYKLKCGDEDKVIKEYSKENTVCWTALNEGINEIVVECKRPNSKEEYESKEVAVYNVKAVEKIEIKDFKCLSDELYAGSEIIFKVDALHSDSRMVLYKFIKIDSSGSFNCIQDYSKKRIVNYVENKCGQFRLLCMVKDMYSQKEFDDRAVILYNIKKYEDIVIKDFTADVTSPQLEGTEINLRAIASGGNKLLYRYIITGENEEDSGYIEEASYKWKTKEKGIYNVKLMVKDESSCEEFEAFKEMSFVIVEPANNSISIKEIIRSKEEELLKGETLKIEVIAEGGIDLRYSFMVKKGGMPIEKIDYGTCNWVEFTPNMSGAYKVEVNVKDKYSISDFDCQAIIDVQAFDYIPAKLEYILPLPRETYLVGEKVSFDIVTRNTRNTLIKFLTSIDGNRFEETDFKPKTHYEIIPKRAGNYEVEIYGVNLKSSEEFDCKKLIKFKVTDIEPIREITIVSDREFPRVNETVTFTVTCSGGREVLYEFYIMYNKEWRLVQKYSRKSFYSFMPFKEGTYKVLVLCKSQQSDVESYEAYDVFSMEV